MGEYTVGVTQNLQYGHLQPGSYDLYTRPQTAAPSGVSDAVEALRPSQEWYRSRIMETLDDEPGVIGGGFTAGWFRCSNPERGHLHPADPAGPCPKCVTEGLGNWSCISAAVPLPAGSVSDAFERAMKASWEMVIPHLTAPNGSYYKGLNNGMADALRTVRANYERELARQPQPGRVEGWDTSRYGYNALFNAISDAVTWHENKTFGISVAAFERAMQRAPTASTQEPDHEQ
jgi:hypothetical protein